jgi:hypothetical protein
MKAPGKGLLKTTGILLIVYGSFSIVISLIVAAGAMLLAALYGTIFKGFTQAFGNAFLPLMFAGAGMGVVDLVLGIVGLKLSAKPAKALFFIISAVAMCLLHAGYAVYISDNSSFFLVFGLIGLAFAAMYIAGGILNGKAAASARETGL